DGRRGGGPLRAQRVAGPAVKATPEHLRRREAWMKSYRPEELVEAERRPVTPAAALAPKGNRRTGANPHVNGGRVLRNLDLADFTDYAISVGRPGSERHESTRQLGKLMRDVFTRTARQQNFRLFCPDETNSNRLV